MKRISFIAYSDIHYHHYSNGITLEDVVAVEQYILDEAISMKVDFIIFGGDRYLSRNPMYEVAFKSDQMLKKISDSGIPMFMLIGNHDRVTKNDFKMHTLGHVHTFANDLPNITIMDQRKEYLFKSKDGSKVAIHAVPAGHSPDSICVSDQNDFNICVFHAIVSGSKYHNGTIAETGLSVTSLDKKGLDIVLGGDNHQQQRLALEHCPGLYIGAPMQHNWGDEGGERGIIFGEMTKSKILPDVIGQLLTKYPKFMKENWIIDTMDQLTYAIQSIGPEWSDNIIRLNITGPADILNSISIDQLKVKLMEQINVRSIDIKLQYEVVDKFVAEESDMSDCNEWQRFLISKSNDLEGVDTTHLEKLGLKYINENV